mgnify:CR=1 FL=1
MQLPPIISGTQHSKAWRAVKLHMARACVLHTRIVSTHNYGGGRGLHSLAAPQRFQAVHDVNLAQHIGWALPMQCGNQVHATLPLPVGLPAGGLTGSPPLGVAVFGPSWTEWTGH